MSKPNSKEVCFLNNLYSRPYFLRNYSRPYGHHFFNESINNHEYVLREYTNKFYVPNIIIKVVSMKLLSYSMRFG